mmetsp:Transcript_24215/g.51438  ORF Transcript_24215/g.51438 Transcript_24215/m.51438 type:complete len:93 (-) Transcript_24215:928-1206(-)
MSSVNNLILFQTKQHSIQSHENVAYRLNTNKLTETGFGFSLAQCRCKFLSSNRQDRFCAPKTRLGCPDSRMKPRKNNRGPEPAPGRIPQPAF